MGASRERDLFKEVAATLVVALMVASATEAFVRRQGTTFVDDTGKVLRVGGTNNYYLHYKVRPSDERLRSFIAFVLLHFFLT